MGPYKTTQFNHRPLLSRQSSQSCEKSAVNYYWTGGHVFLESRAVAMLHSTLYLSCPAGTTTPSLPPPPRHRCTHPHRRVCMCKAGMTVLCLYYALVRWYDPQTSMPHWCGFPFLELAPQTYIPLSQHHVPSRLLPTSCPTPDTHIQHVHVDMQHTHTCSSIRSEPMPF